MKTKLIYLLPLLLLLAFVFGCSKKNETPQPPTIPSGTFTGQFLILRLQKNNSVDTTQANIQLALEGAAGYKVTGDTSTIHAGSYGTYQMSIFTVQFQDKTFSAKSTSVKVHLNGTYPYAFDGTYLDIYVPGDSVGMEYYLKKTGN